MRSKVINNLILKRDHPEKARHIRPLLLCLGGSMRGPYGAGTAVALCELGLERVFDRVVGISTGAPTMAYFLAGLEQMRIATSIYYEECSTKKFINFHRVNKIVDIDYLLTVFRKGAKALDTKAVMKNPTALYVVANDAHGRLVFINAKTSKPDMLAAVKASIAMPVIYGKKIKVNGRMYHDNVIHQFPIREVINKFHPTDILILPNDSYQGMSRGGINLVDYFYGQTTARKMSEDFRRKLINRRAEFRAAAKFAQTVKNPNIEIIWPPHTGLKILTTNSQQLKIAAENAASYAYQKFTGRRKKINLI